MDVYSRKLNFKIALLVLGVVIAITTVVYTNHLANNIAKEEKLKVKLWAEAIARKAKLVRYTKELFVKLEEDERKKVNVFAQSTKFILRVEDSELLTFFNEIITGNVDIPVLLVNDAGSIIASRNIEINGATTLQQLPVKVQKEFMHYEPILVQYRATKNFIYYKDSNLFSKLKKTLNDLVETFISEVVLNTASAPVILTDEKMNVIHFGNLDSTLMESETEALVQIKRMQAVHEPIVVDLGEGMKRFIYYDDSLVLKQLKIFPFVQLGIFTIFLLVSYLAFSNARKSEQNLVWVGMAKETAHQLGTPISSLEGWVAYLRDTELLKDNDQILNELESDIGRLSLVADRFSKIGSTPQLISHNVADVVHKNLDYMRKRASGKVSMTGNCPSDLKFLINEQLFDWVLENLLKNALDAMDGEGVIKVEVSSSGNMVMIDVSDTGKGIPKNKFQTIFEPGYSTKRRGWGLGLSLTKRIVESYHNGKIFVKESELNNGTTFRIEIPKA